MKISLKVSMTVSPRRAWMFCKCCVNAIHANADVYFFALFYKQLFADLYVWLMMLLMYGI